MNWNNIRAEDRLIIWKKMREDLANLPLEVQLSNIATFISAIPIGARSVDYYYPDTWPTPWEILFNGAWCENSISILAFHTLAMLGYKDIELLLIDDKNNRYLVVSANNQYLMNYESGLVSNLQEKQASFKILDRYNTDIIKKIK